jgi:hypothetical protein
MASQKKSYAPSSVREVEKLKESLRKDLWSQPVRRAKVISSSVGAGHGMRLVNSRPLH